MCNTSGSIAFLLHSSSTWILTASRYQYLFNTGEEMCEFIYVALCRMNHLADACSGFIDFWYRNVSICVWSVWSLDVSAPKTPRDIHVQIYFNKIPEGEGAMFEPDKFTVVQASPLAPGDVFSLVGSLFIEAPLVISKCCGITAKWCSNPWDVFSWSRTSLYRSSPRNYQTTSDNWKVMKHFSWICKTT